MDSSMVHQGRRHGSAKNNGMCTHPRAVPGTVHGRLVVHGMVQGSFMDGHGFARGQRHGVGCPLHRSETMPWMMACRGSYGINNTSFERVKDTNIWHKCKKTPQKQISGNHLIHSRRKKEFESAHHAQHTRHGSRQNLDERVRTAFSCRPHYLP